MKPIGPCVHPGCRDQDGNPRLTTQTTCDNCRRFLAKQLNWLHEDYIFIKAYMPKPDTTGPRRRTQITYGHPSAWATDMCRLIAEQLNRIEDDLREELNDAPPANIHTAPEQHVMQSAYDYLKVRIDLLSDRDPDIATDAAETITALHSAVRRTLGYNHVKQRLEGVACPSCDVAALVRSVGQIDCENCYRIITETLYPLLTRIVLDDALDALIDEYDTHHNTPGA